MSEQLFHRRLFLNDETGAAVVEAGFSNNSWTDKNSGVRHGDYSGELHVTDCSRSIELSFHFNTGKDGLDEARKNLRKLDRLIDTLQGMRDAMARAAKREFPGKKF